MCTQMYNDEWRIEMAQHWKNIYTNINVKIINLYVWYDIQ